MSVRTMKKRSGLIPDLRRTPIRKLVKFNNKTAVMTIDESDVSYTIYIGNPEIYCIDSLIEKPKYSDSPETGHLSKIRYDSECSLEHDFERGVDTNNLLKILLTYIARNFKQVKSLTFQDLSTRDCDNGMPVNLALMTYLWKGQTWYQKNFGAYLEGYNKERFDTLEKKFQEKKKNGLVTWNIMKNMMPLDLPLPEDEMKQYFESAEIWQEFFKPIVDKIGIAAFCNFISGWIDRFILQFFNVPFISIQYNLPVKEYNDIQFTISDYVRGGKSKTRRRKYRHSKN